MTIKEAKQAMEHGLPVKINGDGGIWKITATNTLKNSADVTCESKNTTVWSREEPLDNLAFWLGDADDEPK